MVDGWSLFGINSILCRRMHADPRFLRARISKSCKIIPFRPLSYRTIRSPIASPAEPFPLEGRTFAARLLMKRTFHNAIPLLLACLLAAAVLASD